MRPLCFCLLLTLRQFLALVLSRPLSLALKTVLTPYHDPLNCLVQRKHGCFCEKELKMLPRCVQICFEEFEGSFVVAAAETRSRIPACRYLQ